MKNKIILIALSFLASCSNISRPNKEFISGLQNNYDVVYGIDADTYICIDSTGGVYDVSLSIYKGSVLSKIKINK